MKRRWLLKAAALPLVSSFLPGCSTRAAWGALSQKVARIRPDDSRWPDAASWNNLKQAVGGHLIKLSSPFASCSTEAKSSACSEALAQVNDPFYLGDQPALTQTSGWLDAWTSQPSCYAVAATQTQDIVAAVNFARQHNLRLVIKGGGHSYQGTSAAPDSLLVWTRAMNEVTVHEDFVAHGCSGLTAPQPAVTLGSGAMWIDAYHAVTTLGGRYVQGGGCTTVGVAGLIQSGGFGSFSKNYGTAAANLLEAEIVTADGQVRIANASTHADLFWALKGGGGGSLGVVTRLTLRTHELPATFGAVFATIKVSSGKASSDEAFKRLIDRLIEFYTDALFNPHWGEQIAFNSDNTLEVSMVFQGLSQQQAEAIWAPFIDWVNTQDSYSFENPFHFLSLPARHFWDKKYHQVHFPQLVVADQRAGAADHHIVWQGDKGQAGWFIHGFKSAWMPASLLQPVQREKLVDAIFACTRHWSVGFHFNKGLAGARESEINSARNTAMNPDVLDAFALAIIAGGSAPEFPGMPHTALDLNEAKHNAGHIENAMRELLKAAPDAGAYVSESDYFRAAWQTAFWGENYPQLAAVKNKYDPDGFFFVRHGVGSETWSEDGFTRI
jgi:FAD/FMN-containing dehydrogenase